jgi:hypothetical protein
MEISEKMMMNMSWMIGLHAFCCQGILPRTYILNHIYNNLSIIRNNIDSKNINTILLA